MTMHNCALVIYVATTVLCYILFIIRYIAVSTVCQAVDKLMVMVVLKL